MRAIVAFAVALLSFPVLAEVSDKAASQAQLWLQGLVFGIIALLLALRNPLLGLIVGVAGTLLLSYDTFATFSDPHIGRALSAEQGQMYWVVSYFSATLGLLGASIGIVVGYRHRRATGARRHAS